MDLDHVDIVQPSGNSPDLGSGIVNSSQCLSVCLSVRNLDVLVNHCRAQWQKLSRPRFRYSYLILMSVRLSVSKKT